MIESANTSLPYTVSVVEPEENPQLLVFTFVPQPSARASGRAGSPKHTPRYVVTVSPTQNPETLSFDWSESPDDPGPERPAMEREVRERLADRNKWIERVDQLVSQFETWLREMDWSTRRITKKLDDSRVGKHRVSALLMQEETFRVLLEPIGRSTTGADGVVDLYLLPAYDDIASLYFENGEWRLHYIFPGTKPVNTIREADSSPLSKETLEEVLKEMKSHAG